MSTTLTLDDIRAETEKRYGTVHVRLDDGSSVALPSILRLRKDVRAQVFEALKRLEAAQAGDGSDFEAVLCAAEDVLRLASPRADELIDSLGGDGGLLLTVFDKWSGATQPGEASPSQSSATPTATPSSATYNAASD